MSEAGGTGTVSTGKGQAQSPSGERSDPVPLGALGFAEAARRVAEGLRARGFTDAVAFRSPPQDPRLQRSLTRYEGSTVVAVRIRGRDRADVLRDLCTGAVVAVLGGVDEALVDELLVVADPPDEKPEPLPVDYGAEEPF